MTFVDTSFFIALALEDDQLHKKAVAWHRSLRGPFVTTEFVLLELADDLSLPALRGFTAAIFTLVRTDAQFTVLPVSESLFANGYQLYLQRPDKEWGLTDCISFHVMKEHGIVEALSHDHHFEQAGFRALLRHEPPAN